MNDFEIIKIAPERWQEYKQLRLQALQSDPQAFSSSYSDTLQKPDDYWRARLQQAMLGQESWFLFAQDYNKLVGMAGAFIEEYQIAEIVSVYVLPEYRKQGIAQKLLVKLMQLVFENPDVSKLRLTVNPEQKSAVNMYQQLGFQKVGTQQDKMGDGITREECIMEKAR